MKRTLTVAAALAAAMTILLAPAPARAQAPAAGGAGDLKALVASLLDRFPADSAAARDALCAELVGLGPAAVGEACARLLPPGAGNDARARFAVNGLAVHVTRPGAEAERRLFVRAVAAALDRKPDPQVAAFLIAQLQLAGRAESVKPLAARLADANLAGPAAAALRAIGGPDAAGALLRALGRTPGPARPAVVEALGRLRWRPAVKKLLALADGGDEGLRLAARSALAEIGDPAAGSVLATVRVDASSAERAAAPGTYLRFARRLAESGRRAEALAAARAVLAGHDRPGQAAAASEALALLASVLGDQALGDLLAAVDRPDPALRGSALELAAPLGGQAATLRWTEKAVSAPADVRAAIVGMLGPRGDASALPFVRDSLADPDPGVRLAAIPAAARLGGARVLPDLLELLRLPESPHALGLQLDRNDAASSELHLRLYRRGEPIAMSDLLPLLENFDLRILNERPYRVATADGAVFWIQDLEVAHAGGRQLDPKQAGPRFEAAFFAVWQGQAESDGFNRLVLAAGLEWRQALVLRAVCRYLLQTGLPFSQRYMESVLARHPGLAARLTWLFEARFDPRLAPATRTSQQRSLAREIDEALEQVTSPDDDRILRAFRAVIATALRTNHFQRVPGGDPKGYLSIKLEPKQLLELPKPRPMFEIWVYSPRVEGVHLRMGKVARGGLRWSDRREDFRTEILGLMKAQNVKNTLIVPVGAKGGFVPKHLPRGDREAIQREGTECYRIFIRGLLDITDNVRDGKVVPPAEVVRHDPDDPYLVVAADKGTASFSDTANALAAEYGFWLGDAFASGGSAGYDHKKMGITAKGAWECVKRHFREMGIDTQNQPFTVAGIGDMAGDVFGNGMLLSRHIRLVAAFNHQHIFLDPEPDTESSFRERERLFNLPRSSWADYDAALISEGGGVWPRSAKSLPVSPQAAARLGIEAGSLTPNELISASLKAPVDLLYSGGIAYYERSGRLRRDGLITAERDSANCPWRFEVPEGLGDASSPFADLPTAEQLASDSAAA